VATSFTADVSWKGECGIHHKVRSGVGYIATSGAAMGQKQEGRRPGTIHSYSKPNMIRPKERTISSSERMVSNYQLIDNSSVMYLVVSIYPATQVLNVECGIRSSFHCLHTGNDRITFISKKLCVQNLHIFGKCVKNIKKNYRGGQPYIFRIL
jgi:hypothetical protein